MRFGKRRVTLLLILTVLILFAAYLTLKYVKQSSLNKPESIAYNEFTQSILISNMGNGRILSMNKKGKMTTFAKGLKAPRGLKTQDSLLWVADNTKLQAYNLTTKKLINSVTIEGAKMLNDIETDHQGKLYVTDTQANRLFVYDPASGEIQSFESELLQAPNGIVYDAPRRQMFIVSFRKASPILAFNVVTEVFSVFRHTLYDNLDGIAIDELGRIYFSSWEGECIYMIPQEQNRFLIWQSNLQSPADIFHHEATGEILVPLLEKNQIKRFKIDS
ncbi:MAG: SMP-30/gluconolactonase/LRE family protein [Candidatus Cloacimonadaceae bacterium]|jgi:sugar lactone lactonase YvrE|nr:SMP-30/gluconolactonase/LRE family protein [Candidatus Cloacimonadota bacterium]MDX9950028.1 SMP-30/gluconolactonase/LRE family protein [Candidatus Syntrophosphaera sp.]NLN84548.1 hypothetical protein [Candidatus Cloacimonadota bacterium]